VDKQQILTILFYFWPFIPYLDCTDDTGNSGEDRGRGGQASRELCYCICQRTAHVAIAPTRK